MGRSRLVPSATREFYGFGYSAQAYRDFSLLSGSDWESLVAPIPSALARAKAPPRAWPDFLEPACHELFYGEIPAARRRARLAHYGERVLALSDVLSLAHPSRVGRIALAVRGCFGACFLTKDGLPDILASSRQESAAIVAELGRLSPPYPHSPRPVAERVAATLSLLDRLALGRG